MLLKIPESVFEILDILVHRVKFPISLVEYHDYFDYKMLDLTSEYY